MYDVFPQITKHIAIAARCFFHIAINSTYCICKTWLGCCVFRWRRISLQVISNLRWNSGNSLHHFLFAQTDWTNFSYCQAKTVTGWTFSAFIIKKDSLTLKVASLNSLKPNTGHTHKDTWQLTVRKTAFTATKTSHSNRTCHWRSNRQKCSC